MTRTTTTTIRRSWPWLPAIAFQMTLFEVAMHGKLDLGRFVEVFREVGARFPLKLKRGAPRKLARGHLKERQDKNQIARAALKRPEVRVFSLIKMAMTKQNIH